jgi:hypothetical protein
VEENHGDFFAPFGAFLSGESSLAESKKRFNALNVEVLCREKDHLPRNPAENAGDST